MEPSDAEIAAVLAAAPAAAWASLRAAADALAADESPAATWTSEPGQVPYPAYSDAVSRLLGALGGVGAVVVYDWMGWDGPSRYPRGAGLEAAPVADAARMVTAVIRGERFGDGTIAEALDDGSLLAAATRLLHWHESERPGA